MLDEKKMNNYINDSKIFFHRCTPFITEKISNPDIIDATLFYALGIEKLLKGILWKINPVYIYSDPSFKNTISIIYPKKLLPSHTSNKEILQSPKNDTLTFRRALSRVKDLSETTNKYVDTLFTLATYRDIIIHATIEELNYEKAKKLLLESYFPIMKDYSLELEISLSSLIGNQIQGLEFLSKHFKDETAEAMPKKIRFYNQEWNRIKSDSSHSKRIKELKEQYSNGGDTDCPSCGNPADIDLEADYDYADGQSYVAGVYPVALRCKFCGLTLTDFDELDFINIRERMGFAYKTV